MMNETIYLNCQIKNILSLPSKLFDLSKTDSAGDEYTCQLVTTGFSWDHIVYFVVDSIYFA